MSEEEKQALAELEAKEEAIRAERAAKAEEEAGEETTPTPAEEKSE